MARTQTFSEVVEDFRCGFPYNDYKCLIWDYIYLCDNRKFLWWYQVMPYMVRAHIIDINKDIDKMRKKQTAPKQTETQDKVTSFGGYKNIRLTDTELAQFDSIYGTDELMPFESLQYLLTFGKVVLTPDFKKFTATLTVPHEKQLWSISSFAGDFSEAICLLAYKVTEYPEWLKSENSAVTSRG